MPLTKKKVQRIIHALIFTGLLTAITALDFSGNPPAGCSQHSSSAGIHGANSETELSPFPSNPDSTFIIGVQTFGYTSITDNDNDAYNWAKQMPYIDNIFHFNTLNFWAGSVKPPYDGGLFDPVSRYAEEVNKFMNYISSNGKIGIYGRQTYEKLCWAQRSTYQPELSGFYGFRNDVSPVTGSVFNDEKYGVSGRLAKTGTNQPGYLVSGLVENGEQSDNWYYAGAGAVDDSLWFVKPCMRIDPSIVKNNPDLPVARIDIIAFDNTLVKSVNIRAGNFGSSLHPYTGNYTEEYYGFGGDTSLTVPGSASGINKGARTTFDGNAYTLEDSKVDYRIWWYGKCNLWVDYIRLDDKWADELFKGKWDEKIIQEDSAFSSAYAFYIDEIRFNNLPAMRYIQQKIKSYNPNSSLAAIPLSAMNVGLRNRLPNSMPYLDSMTLTNPYSVPKFLLSDYYVLNTTGESDNINYRCWLPPGLEPVNMPNLRFLWKNSSYDLYNSMLQSRLGDKAGNDDATVSIFNLSLIAGYNRMQLDAMTKGIRHIPVIQAHSWMHLDKDTKIMTGSLREPTNEELRVFVNLAVCYGAKGYIYFQYPSYNSAKFEAEGLTRKGDNYYVEPVTGNYYGENKAQETGALDQKYSVLGPVLMTLSWQNAYSVHSEGAEHSYIKDIRSAFSSGGEVHYDEVKYWEMGFFTSAEGTRYFMMVNRRCVPGSDVRKLGIKFNADSLASHRRWKLTEVYTKQEITYDVLTQGADGFVTLPEAMQTFQPGEGKLFKLEPAG